MRYAVLFMIFMTTGVASSATSSSGDARLLSEKGKSRLMIVANVSIFVLAYVAYKKYPGHRCWDLLTIVWW